jgi:predicted nuclease of predicted toxin-antitoxin system
MKFLLDSNLSHRVAQLLRDASIDAAHLRDHDLQHATDSVILEFARRHAFVLVSEDTDFGELLARQSAGAPSFVLLRTYEPMTPNDQAAVLVANLPRLYDDLDQGAIVVIERSRLRVRRLPVLPPIPEQREQ